jgi:hypothetical protein
MAEKFLRTGMGRLKKCNSCSDFENEGMASFAQILATAQST